MNRRRLVSAVRAAHRVQLPADGDATREELAAHGAQHRERDGGDIVVQHVCLVRGVGQPEAEVIGREDVVA